MTIGDWLKTDSLSRIRGGDVRLAQDDLLGDVLREQVFGVEENLDVDATLDATLDSATLSATATVRVSGGLTASLGAASLSATAGPVVTGFFGAQKVLPSYGESTDTWWEGQGFEKIQGVVPFPLWAEVSPEAWAVYSPAGAVSGAAFPADLGDACYVKASVFVAGYDTGQTEYLLYFCASDSDASMLAVSASFAHTSESKQWWLRIEQVDAEEEGTTLATKYISGVFLPFDEFVQIGARYSNGVVTAYINGRAAISAPVTPGAGRESGFAVGGAFSSVSYLTNFTAGPLPTTLANAALSASASVASSSGITATLSATLADAALSSNIDALVDADLSATLSAATLASNVDVIVDADLSATLGASTLSASADVIAGATLAQALAASALSANVDVIVGASVAQTLGSASLSSNVDVLAAASLTQALGAATLGSNVDVVVAGTLAQGLAPATLAASGIIAATGALSATLANTALSSSADVLVDADLTATLQAAALSAASSVAVGGALTQALGTATLSSNVDVLVNGTLTAQLGNAGLSAQVGVGVGAALAAQLGEAALAAAGAVTVSAAVNATLEAAALAGTVDTSESISASLDAVLEDVGLLANADVIVNVLGAERFVDDFNRADGPVGSNYDPHPLFWIGQTLPDITGNSVHGTSASSYRAAILQQPIGATQFARMRVRKPTTPSENNSYRIFLRASPPEVSPACLVVQFFAFGTADGNVQWVAALSKIDDVGGLTNYGTQVVGWSSDEFVDFEVSYDGAFLRGAVPGLGPFSYEVGPVTSGDRVGFGFLLYDGEIDNFEAGYLGRQLGDATLSATASVVISGATYATFDNAVVSGAVAVNVTGSVSAVLDASTLAASADTILGASLAAQLGPATVSGIAQIRVTAQLAATLQAAALAGAADVVDRIAPSSGTTSSASDGPTLGYTARQTVEPGSGQIYIGSGMVVLADRLLQLTPESGSVRIRSGIDMAIGDQVDPVLPAMFIHLDGAMWVALDLPYLERALPAPTP